MYIRISYSDCIFQSKLTFFMAIFIEFERPYRIEDSLERHIKHDTFTNCSYNSTLKCLNGTYIVFTNRSAEKLYDFGRLVFDFEILLKADSIRIEIHNSPTEHRNYSLKEGLDSKSRHLL